MFDVITGLRPRADGGWVNKDPADDYWYTPRGLPTTAGVDVNEDVALTFSTVYACVSKIAKTRATLPLQVYEKSYDRKHGRKVSHPVDHELNELLTVEANKESPAIALRESQSINEETWGNSFVAIDWNLDKLGRPFGSPGRLWALPAREMEVKRDGDGELVYLWRPAGGGQEVIPNDRMWHVPGLSLNGIMGISPIAHNRQLLGLGIAVHEFGSAFFGNGAWAGGFIKRPTGAPKLSPEAANKFLQDLNERFRGSSKAFGFGMLRDDMELQQFDMPFEDAMFLGTRRQTRIEVCGMFDVPVIAIHDDERSSMRNAEEAGRVFAWSTMLPRCVRYERSAKRRFFLGSKLYLRHNLAGLVRGDFKTRMEAYAIGRQWGFLSINDVRELEDMNPVDGGNSYLEPLNMQPVGGGQRVQVASDMANLLQRNGNLIQP